MRFTFASEPCSRLTLRVEGQVELSRRRLPTLTRARYCHLSDGVDKTNFTRIVKNRLITSSRGYFNGWRLAQTPYNSWRARPARGYEEPFHVNLPGSVLCLCSGGAIECSPPLSPQNEIFCGCEETCDGRMRVTARSLRPR